MKQKFLSTVLFFSLIVFPFGQLAVLSVHFLPTVRFLLLDSLVVVFALFFFLFQIVGKKKLKKSHFFLPGLLFLIFTLVSLLVNLPALKIGQALVAALYLFRLAVYFGFYLALINQKIFSKKELICYLKTIGFFISIFGLIQYFFWPDLTTLKYLGWDDHYFRLTGLLLDPNFTGLLLVFSLLLFYFDKSKWFLSKTIVLPVLALSVALTYSRGAFLSLFVAGLFALILYKRIKFFFLVILFLVAVILLLPRSSGGEGVKLERLSTVNARLQTTSEAIELFKTKPFFGVGFNALRYQRNDESLKIESNRAGGGIDNSFLLVLATTGFLGFASFIFLAIKVFTFSVREKLILLSLSLVALGVNGLFINSLFYPWVMFWLVILLVAYGE